MEKFESFPLAKWDAMNTHASTMVWYPTWFLNNLPSFTGIDKRLVLQTILLNGELGSLIKEFRSFHTFYDHLSGVVFRQPPL